MINGDIQEYLVSAETTPLFLVGDSADVLKSIPSESIDCVITSPPYWMKREYLANGIGLEQDWRDYVDNLVCICREIHRVLKDTGSFWLNLGDSYADKHLMNIPARVAIRLTDEIGFVLRNEVVWNKMKGAPDNSKDRLRNLWEPVYHFTKTAKGYYYNIDAIRIKPRRAQSVEHGKVVSATGVSGVRYKRKIELSTELTDEEKENAYKALDEVLREVESGVIPDFRMVIRGATRTTHGNSTKLSGRAKELADKGFYFLKYNNKGAKMPDVWDIVPEDTQGRKYHYAPYPEDLVKNPIALTCPQDGIVLDPFVGTGTTCKVAAELNLKSIGIDTAIEYLKDAEERCSHV